MASYPTSIWSDGDNEDGETVVNAAYMDERDDEIIAIETALGTGLVPTNESTSLSQHVRIIEDTTGQFSARIGISYNTKVGIGPLTNAPISRLELYDGGGVTFTITSASASADGAILFRTGATPSSRYRVGVDTDADKFVIASGTQPLGGTNDRFTISSAGRVAVSAPNSAASGSDVSAGQVTVYLDQTNDKLMFLAKYSDGSTVKTGEVALA